MGQIIISDLEVQFRVGVPDAERKMPQRLLVTFVLEHPFEEAAATDSVRATIDYALLRERFIAWGHGREWRLIETLAMNTGQWILDEFRPRRVTVEVKKFILPDAAWVGVRATLPHPPPAPRS